MNRNTENNYNAMCDDCECEDDLISGKGCTLFFSIVLLIAFFIIYGLIGLFGGHPK